MMYMYINACNTNTQFWNDKLIKLIPSGDKVQASHFPPI